MAAQEQEQAEVVAVEAQSVRASKKAAHSVAQEKRGDAGKAIQEEMEEKEKFEQENIAMEAAAKKREKKGSRRKREKGLRI